MAHNDRAEEYVKLMGGRDAVINSAKEYIKKGDFTYAAEILTYPIRINNDDMEARNLKAKAYTLWGYEQVNVNWRNWAMTAAGELRGDLDYNSSLNYTSPDVLQNLPTEMILDMMTVRMKGAEIADVTDTVSVTFSDTGEAFTYKVRNGIAELRTVALEDASTQIVLTRALLNRILGQGQTALAEGIQDGEFTFVKGDMVSFQQFLGYFEQPKTGAEIPLIVR